MEGEVALQVRDLIRQMTMEKELQNLAGKTQVLLAYHPHRDIGTVMQWLKRIISWVLPHVFRTCEIIFFGHAFLSTRLPCRK